VGGAPDAQAAAATASAGPEAGSQVSVSEEAAIAAQLEETQVGDQSQARNFTLGGSQRRAQITKETRFAINNVSICKEETPAKVQDKDHL